MRSVLAGIRTLVLPFGAAFGQRIVLNGDTGRIEIYDENDNLVILIDHNGIQFFDFGQGIMATFFTTAGTVATTGGAETALAGWDASSDTAITFAVNRLYRLSLVTGCYESAGAPAEATVRVRRDVGDVASQRLAFWRAGIPTGLGANVSGYAFVAYVKNVSGGDVVCTPGLSIEHVTGAGTVSLFGDSDLQCLLVVEDVGSAVAPEKLALAAAATSIV